MYKGVYVSDAVTNLQKKKIYLSLELLECRFIIIMMITF